MSQVSPVFDSVITDLEQADLWFRQKKFEMSADSARQALSTLLSLDHGQLDYAALLDRAYYRLIDALYWQRNMDEARQQITLWQTASHRKEGAIDAQFLSARLMLREGHTDQAMRLTDEALREATKLDYERGQAALYKLRGDILWIRGEMDKALAQSLLALEIYERLSDWEGIARTQVTVAGAYHLKGRFYDSIVYSSKAAALYKMLNDDALLAVMYNNLGESYQQLYAMQEAFNYHELAMKMLKDKAGPDLIRNFGVDLVATGYIDEGIERLKEALDKSRQIGYQDIEMHTLNSLAEAYYQNKQIDLARSTAEALMTLARASNAIQHIARAALILGYCARAKGDKAAVTKYFVEGASYAHSATNKSLLWQVHAALAEMFAETNPPLSRMYLIMASETVKFILETTKDDALRETVRTAAPVAKLLSDAEAVKR